MSSVSVVRYFGGTVFHERYAQSSEFSMHTDPNFVTHPIETYPNPVEFKMQLVHADMLMCILLTGKKTQLKC